MKWKQIKEITYRPYFVSNTGLIKNVDNHIMSQTKNPITGYMQIRLSIASGKAKTFRVHRLVAQEFISNPHNYPDINHKNEIRTDNRVENLEWCTHKYNQNYGNRNDRVSESQRQSRKSRRIPIIVILPNGIEKYAHSLREASEITGWNRATIQRRLENPNAIFDKNTYHFRYVSKSRRTNNKSIIKYGDQDIDHTKSLSYQDVMNKLKHIHPNLIITSAVQNTHKLAHFRCLTCGYEFDKTPHEVFQQKWGCAKCADRASARAKIKDKSDAQEAIKTYLYDNLIVGDDYEKMSEPATYTCKRCGKQFIARLTNLLHNAKKHGYVSNGCQSCSKSRSVTITNLKKYGHDIQSIREELHKKGLDWCKYNPE